MTKKRLCILLAMLSALVFSTCAAAEQFTFSLVGDCTVGDQWKYHGYKSSFTYKITQSGLDYPFSLVADLFAADDLTIANCEGVLTDRRPGSNAKFMTLGAPTSFGEVFKLGNVELKDQVEKTLLEMADDGTFGKIAEKYGLSDSVCLGK